MKDKIYLPRQLVSDTITVNSMELKSQNESGMLSDEDYLEKKQDIQDSLNSQNIQCRETQNKFESENKTSKSTKLKKWIILAITVVVLTAIIVSIVVNYINENTYKIDMDYTQDSIEHFIEGIEENGDYYGISISDIDVDEDIAIADLYVEKYFNKPVEIRLIFEYGYDGTSTKKRYTLSITHFSSYSEIIDIETAVSVAESVELMLTGETKIQEGHNTNYNSDNWDSFDTYRHQFDGYNVEYHYSYVTKDSFHYKIKFFYR